MNGSAKNGVVIAAGVFILIFLIVLQGIPLVNGILIVFRDYNVFKGFSESQFIGFANISKLFSDINFLRALFSTVWFNVLYLVMVLILGCLLSISLMTVHKKIRNIFLAIILLPLFIPGSILVHIFTFWFRETNIFMSPVYLPFVYASLMAVKNAGIPTVFIFKTWGTARKTDENTGFERIMAPVSFVFIQLVFILSTDVDVSRNLINAFAFKVWDTLDNYIFSMGFVRFQVGVTQAAWLIQAVVHVVLGLVVYIILRFIAHRKTLSQDSKNGSEQISEPEKINGFRTNPAGCIMPALYSLFLLWFVFKPLLINGVSSLFKGMPPVDPAFIASYIRYIILYGLIALIGVPISAALAKSAAYPGIFGSITRVMLVLFVLAGGMGMHPLLFYRRIGIFDTIFSLVVYYLFPVANSLVLAVIIAFKRENNQDVNGGLSLWKHAFILSLIRFIVMWNSEYAPLVFLAKQETMPPVLLPNFISQSLGGHIYTGAVTGADFLTALLPIVLFLIFRKFITEWVLLSFTKSK